MGIVDLDLLFQIPKKDARIIEGKGEEASSKGSTMEVKNVLKSLGTLGKKLPFYTPSRGMTVGSKMRWTNMFQRQNWRRRSAAEISGQNRNSIQNSFSAVC